LSNLESELSQLLEQQQLYELKAPMDGIAIGFRGLQEGLFIAQGQVIGEISPESRLLAEVYLSPRDVGFVSQGQQTKILVDAFPHTEWGTLTGKVKEISRDFIQLGDQIAFRVTIELDQLGLRSRKGVKVDVKRGMTVSSRFVIRERTLFSILFSKMSDAFDPREITQDCPSNTERYKCPTSDSTTLPIVARPACRTSCTDMVCTCRLRGSVSSRARIKAAPLLLS